MKREDRDVHSMERSFKRERQHKSRDPSKDTWCQSHYVVSGDEIIELINEDDSVVFSSARTQKLIELLHSRKMADIMNVQQRAEFSKVKT
jgi:hypothetical protein